MVDGIETIERRLVRVESWVLVGCVTVMLLLAGYNVLYRNALMPLQSALQATGAPASESAPEPSEDGAEESGDFEGGFGDGADGEAPESGEPSGFEGGFGTPEDGAVGENDSESDGATGFEGGFGEPAGEGEASGTDSELEVKGAVEGEQRTEESDAGGTFADAVVEAIDAMEVAWIDLLLRQLVLVVGFLGAMVAVGRREHITIDVAGQIVGGRTAEALDTITSLVAAGVCSVLAVSGWSLVELGMRYPRDLLPGAREWVFQLMFPVGFALMALHFLLRAFVSGATAWRGDEAGEDGAEEGAREEAG